MDLAIGHEDRTRNPVARHIRHQAFQCAIKMRAVIVRIGFQHAHFQRRVRLQLAAQGAERGAGRARAITELHALRPVEYDRRDRGKRLALFFHERRVRQGGRKQCQAEAARQSCPAPQGNIGQPGQRGDGNDQPKDRPA